MDFYQFLPAIAGTMETKSMAVMAIRTFGNISFFIMVLVGPGPIVTKILISCVIGM